MVFLFLYTTVHCQGCKRRVGPPTLVSPRGNTPKIQKSNRPQPAIVRIKESHTPPFPKCWTHLSSILEHQFRRSIYSPKQVKIKPKTTGWLISKFCILQNKKKMQYPPALHSSEFWDVFVCFFFFFCLVFPVEGKQKLLSHDGWDLKIDCTFSMQSLQRLDKNTVGVHISTVVWHISM